MRSLLFFDLPTEKVAQRRAYTKFVKHIKSLGFYMLQESVYVKMSIDAQAVSSTIHKVKTALPSEGSVFVLTVTEKQFNSMDFLLGDNLTEVVTSDERLIEL